MFRLSSLMASCRGAGAQSVERPVKGPRSWYNSTDVGSKHADAAALGGRKKSSSTKVN